MQNKNGGTHYEELKARPPKTRTMLAGADVNFGRMVCPVQDFFYRWPTTQFSNLKWCLSYSLWCGEGMKVALRQPREVKH